MKCPYNPSSTKRIENTENQIIDEETGIYKGCCTTVVESYAYCECVKEECAVYYNGRCHYNG